MIDSALAPDRWQALLDEYADANDEHSLYRLKGLVRYWWPTPFQFGCYEPACENAEQTDG